MTAEVAIVNASAVAIAADSAVTIGGGKKIYNSALKVFALSKVAPVGIMVYGNAGLLGVPWETLVKIYRQNLKTKTFSHLEDYAKHFLSFISRQSSYFPKEAQDGWIQGNIRGYYELIRKELFRKVEEVLKKQGNIDDSQAGAIFLECVTKHYNSLDKRPYVIGFDKKSENRLRTAMQDLSRTLMKETFQGIKPTKILVSKLYNISAFLHCRQIFSDSTSGVVVSGFGEKDIYPVVCTYEIEGILGKRLKYRHRVDKSAKVKNSGDCSIIPFAQDDMVTSFMEGMNPAVARFITQYLTQLIKRFTDLLQDNDLSGNDQAKVQLRNRLKGDIKKLTDEFFSQLNSHKRAEHIDPILNMVQVLPKDELAAMAESLVNLTAFKRRMTDQLETVGGPIDVAVISKGDGLVWVKRKHYFPAELNQHFFSNYFRGIANEET